jgi:hypothetical protein
MTLYGNGPFRQKIVIFYASGSILFIRNRFESLSMVLHFSHPEGIILTKSYFISAMRRGIFVY